MTCINFPCEWASDELEYIPSSSTDDVFTPFLYPFEDNNLGNIVDTPPKKIQHEWVDVFPIEAQEFPASHVSERRGVP